MGRDMLTAYLLLGAVVGVARSQGISLRDGMEPRASRERREVQPAPVNGGGVGIRFTSKHAKAINKMAENFTGPNTESQLMEPHNNLDNLLWYSPAAVHYLTTLSLLGSTRDFTMVDDETLTKFPNLTNYLGPLQLMSFRNCLSFLGDEGYQALKTAHISMLTINHQLSNVDGYLEDIIKMFYQPVKVKKILSKRVLPRAIENLRNVTDETVIAAHEAVHAMDKVNNVTGEIIQLTYLKNKNAEESAQYLKDKKERKMMERKVAEEV